MKERLKELAYWFQDKLRALCGEITPDKRLTVILVMLLLFTIANLYFTFTTVYNWGKERERQEQSKTGRIKSLELRKQGRKQDFKDNRRELIDSEIPEQQIDSLSLSKLKQDSINDLQSINKQKLKRHEPKIKIKRRAEAKA